MAGTNITRDDARARAAVVRAPAYRVEVDLAGAARGDATFPSRTVVDFDAEPGADSWIDLIAPSIRRVVLNGATVPSEAYDGARLALTGLAAHNVLEVEADCAYMTTGEGLHRFVDPVDERTYVYSQFEVADARRVYACFDQPDLKGTFTLSVTAPADWQVVSASPTPDPVVDGSDARWDFAATPPLSTYVTSLIAGPYHAVRDRYEGEHGTYPLAVMCRASLAEHLDADEVLTVTKQGFEFFERCFATPYPFAKYDQVFVPEFNAGAMENVGAVTIADDYVFRSRVTDAAYEVRANTILHELAHMWFGDLVTMVWWDDLWLNESFAEWAAHWASVEATRYTEAWTTFNAQRKAWGYRQDQLPSTHPIVADMVDLEAVEVNFDGITYAKGAAALRQLVAWVGEKEFLAALRAYFTKYAWGNTTLADLLGELERASGRDLREWSRLWLETSGVNQLAAQVSVAAGRYTDVTVVQSPPSAPPGLDPVLRPHRVAIGLYDRDATGALTRTRRLEIDVAGRTTPVTALVGEPAADMLLLNDDDLTFAKVRLDPASMQTAVTALDTAAPPLARAIVWGAAWDMTRDGEMPVGDYLTLVLHGLSAESEIGVTQQVLGQLRVAIEQYAAPGHRLGYRDALAVAADSLLVDAAPGSDLQLVLVRTYAAAARTPEQTARMAGWLEGVDVPSGLAVDTELRWSLLVRLVALGAAGEEAIAAELARDDSATGRRHAATARAAMPTPEAKEAAFVAATEDLSLTNAMLTATIVGFAQPDGRELLAPYVDRYFAALPEVWATRTNEIAQTITMGLFPTLLVGEDVVARTDAFLARTDVPSGARRLVTESRDGMLRAMRAQQADS